MKQITTLVLTFLCFTCLCVAQHPALDYLNVLEADLNDFSPSTYLNTNDSDIDSQGNLIIVGDFNGTIDMDPSSGVFLLTAQPSPPPGDNPLIHRNTFIAKYSSDGDLVWAYKLGDDSNYVITSQLKVDANDNIIIAGGYKYSVDFDLWDSQHILNSPNSGRTFVASYKPDGEFRWVNQIFPATSSSASASDLELKSNGNIVLAGTFNGNIVFPNNFNFITLNNTGAPNSYLAELNSTGTWITARHVADPNFFRIESIVVDSNDNIICSIRETALGAPLLYSYTIRKYFSSQLAYQDIIVLVPENFNTGFSVTDIAIDGQDNLYLGGFNKVNVSVNGSIFLAPSTPSLLDGFLFKMDDQNTVLWKKSFTPEPTPGLIPYYLIRDVEVDNSNRIILAATLKGKYDLGNGVTAAANNIFQFNTNVTKFNQSGDAIWTDELEGNTNTTSVSVASLHIVGDQFYLYGELAAFTDFDFHPFISTNTSPAYGEPDVYMVRYDDVIIDTIKSLSKSTQDFEVYPTIVKDRFTVKAPSDTTGPITVEIIDLNGNVKATFNAQHKDLKREFYPKGLKTGIYVLKISDYMGNILKKVKLIKE